MKLAMFLRFTLCKLALVAVVSAFSHASISAGASDKVLARVEIAGNVRNFPLPAHALFQDAAGFDYLLVFATPQDLQSAGWKWKSLAQDAVPDEFQFAMPLRPGAAAAMRSTITPIFDDGLRWIVRLSADEIAELREAGFAVNGLAVDPLDLTSEPPPLPRLTRADAGSRKFLADPMVAEMIGNVESTNLWWLLRRLTGEEPVIAGNEPARITSRTTTSPSLRKALQFAYERFQHLGLEPQYHSWVHGSTSNLNLVATLPGTTLSNELVLVTAHLDNVPASGLAPGADDNGSGSAAVLTAAGILAQYRFERTIRLILFTGEEQGLWGSTAYATSARSANDNIVGVLNLDMLGFDSKAPADFELHTRVQSHPMYSNDLAILTVFTNVVDTYGLSPAIVPVHKPSGINASDHYPFWTRNYAGILAIEDMTKDFTPYYHTLNDKVATLNFNYLTTAVKASVATAAHMAIPVERTAADTLQVVASDWRINSPTGSRVVALKHSPSALETDLDPFDVMITNAVVITNTASLEAFSDDNGLVLVSDARPESSSSSFRVFLTASEHNLASLSSSNQLHIEFLGPPEPDRVYNARIQVDPAFTVDQTPFECVTNLVELARQGNRLALPNLTNVPPGQVYGTCEIDCRFVDQSRSRCRLEWVQFSSTTLGLASEAQVGCQIVDSIEFSPAFVDNSWQTVATFTNRIAPDSASFETGWKRVQYEIDTTALPPTGDCFLRLHRQWLVP